MAIIDKLVTWRHILRLSPQPGGEKFQQEQLETINEDRIHWTVSKDTFKDAKYCLTKQMGIYPIFP